MRKRISRISVLQTASMFGVLYAILGLVAVPIFYGMTRLAPLVPGSGFPAQGAGFPSSGIFLVMLPVAYGCMGFLITVVGAVIYNVVAGWVGGIEFEVTDVAG